MCYSFCRSSLFSHHKVYVHYIHFSFRYWTWFYGQRSWGKVSTCGLTKEVVLSRQTSGLYLFDAHLHHLRDEGVLRLHEGGQVDAEHPLDVLHVRHAVVRHLLWTLLVCVETTVWKSTQKLTPILERSYYKRWRLKIGQRNKQNFFILVKQSTNFTCCLASSGLKWELLPRLLK